MKDRADSLIQTLKENLNALSDINKGHKTAIQFSLTDINTQYVIHLKEDGTVTNIFKNAVEKEPADVTVQLTVDIMESIMKKEIHPVMAMTQGLLTVEGDISVLTRLLPVISR